MNRKFLLTLVLGAASIGAGSAQATTATATFPVSATVLSTCLVAATPLLFGNYDPNSTADLDATNTVTVTCTSGASYDVGLDAGTGTGATVASRKMSFGTNVLNYTLYQDATRTTVWGNTVGTDTVNATATAGSNIHTVYGRVPSGQNVPAGAYTDNITVTVTY